MSKLLSQFEKAKRVSTPIIVVKTPDPANTMLAIVAHYTKEHKPVPVICWDIVRGFWFNKLDIKVSPSFLEVNQASQAALRHICKEQPPDSFINPVSALAAASNLPEDCIFFFLQSHRHIGNAEVAQAVWNLRDIYKANGQTLVLLCPSIQLPAELLHDVTVLDEPLPTVKELEAIVLDIHKAGSLKEPSGEALAAATDALCGLASFTASQVTAMSLSKSGLNLDSLWERKRMQIEQTPGLSVWKGQENFQDVKDCDNVINFLISYAANIGAVVFIDEIEKAMAGASGDTSGVSQEMHGTLLSWMQDTGAKGMLFLGHPGTGKSLLAKCAGTIAKKPVIRFDLAAMKNSLVGESNARLKSCLDVVDAVSNGRPLVIATCNKIEALSPELRRRFKSGTFFFDLPSKTGRNALWKLYTDKFKLGAWTETSKPGFDDSGWTGAEIETCCELAHDLKQTIIQASQYIVPISRSAPDSIKSLQSQATGKFISASHSGTYQPETESPASSNRRMDLN